MCGVLLPLNKVISKNLKNPLLARSAESPICMNDPCPCKHVCLNTNSEARLHVCIKNILKHCIILVAMPYFLHVIWGNLHFTSVYSLLCAIGKFVWGEKRQNTRTPLHDMFRFPRFLFFKKHAREENQDGMAHRSNQDAFGMVCDTVGFSRFLQFLMNIQVGLLLLFAGVLDFEESTCGQFYSRSCLKHVHFYNMHVPNSPPCGFCVCFCPCLKRISSSLLCISLCRPIWLFVDLRRECIPVHLFPSISSVCLHIS